MKTAFSIRKLIASDWNIYRAIRLRALQDSPDAFAVTYAEQIDRTDQSWESRLAAAAQSANDLPLIAELDGAPVGLAWAKVDPADAGIVEVFQVWVAPQARGRGIAAALMRQAAAWARGRGARAVTLGVTSGDTPAVRLYRREGFREVGEAVPLRPGSPLLSQAMRLEL